MNRTSLNVKLANDEDTVIDDRDVRQCCLLNAVIHIQRICEYNTNQSLKSNIVTYICDCLRTNRLQLEWLNDC